MKRGAKNQGDSRFLEEQAPLVAMADGRRRASTVRQACVLVLGWFESTPSAMRPIADMCASAQGPERTRWIARIHPLGDRLPQVPSQLGYEPTLLPCERKDALRSMCYPSGRRCGMCKLLQNSTQGG